MDAIVAAARAQLDDLDAKRDKLLKIIELAESMDTPTIPQGREEAPKPPVRRPSTVTLATYEAVRSILLEHGKPMKTSDLLAGVIERGVEVGGKKPAYTLSARLSNSKEFKGHRGVGWWFADRPLPGAGAESDEAEGSTTQASPSASNPSQGGSHGTALAE